MYLLSSREIFIIKLCHSFEETFTGLHFLLSNSQCHYYDWGGQHHLAPSSNLITCSCPALVHFVLGHTGLLAVPWIDQVCANSGPLPVLIRLLGDALISVAFPKPYTNDQTFPIWTVFTLLHFLRRHFVIFLLILLICFLICLFDQEVNFVKSGILLTALSPAHRRALGIVRGSVLFEPRNHTIWRFHKVMRKRLKSNGNVAIKLTEEI